MATKRKTTRTRSSTRSSAARRRSPSKGKAKQAAPQHTLPAGFWAQVSAVRGVNVDGVIRTLVLRGLIREVAGGHARRYETTELFLELLGIDSLDRLPDLAPLLPDIDSIDEFDL